MLFFFLFTADKAAACEALNSSLHVLNLNATLLDCNIDCCTGNKCNNQNFTVIPTIPGHTTPSAVSPTTGAHGNILTHVKRKYQLSHKNNELVQVNFNIECSIQYNNEYSFDKFGYCRFLC